MTMARPAVAPPDPAAALGECLGERAAAARRLGAAIDAGDAAAARAEQERLGRLSAALPGLQQRLGPVLPTVAPEVLDLIRALAGEIKNADAAVSLALGRAGAASLPMWLLAHGQPSAAALETLLAPPWDKDRDLVGLTGTGSWAIGQQLLARGQNRVLVVDPTAPPTPPRGDEPDAALWNVHGQEGLDAAVDSMTWPLPAQLRLVEIGAEPPWSATDLHGRLSRALEFSSVGKLQLLEEARLFALKASRNLAVLARTPSITQLRGALPGLPAVVVSAGPSLDKNIGLLKSLQGKVVIVAINQTVAGLRRAGVRPDVVVAVDPLNISYHFEGTRPGDIGTLLLGASVDPALFQIPCDRLAHFSSSPVVEQWMYDFLGEHAAVSAEGTVSTAAVKMCAWLGCTTIISIGRDLAMAGDKYYADNAADGGGKFTVSANGRQIDFSDYTSRHRLAEGGDEAAQQEVQQLLGAQVYDLGQVRGFYGPPVSTTNLFIYEIEQLRRTVEGLRGSIRFINATEGGAYLEGMEHMSLAEAAQQVARSHPEGTGDVDARLQRRLDAAATTAGARQAHMAAQLGDLARDLRRMETLAREALYLAGASSARGAARSAQIGAELAALSRARPFLSVMVQRATQSIVKKGGPAFASGDDVTAAERVLYTSIADLIALLAPRVEAAVAELGPPAG